MNSVWPDQMPELIEWFRRNRARLPRKRFTLSPGVVVSDTDRFFEALECDVQAGPDGPRGRRGAVCDDLRRLRELFADRSMPPPQKLQLETEALAR
jgi:hypothetical protein